MDWKKTAFIIQGMAGFEALLAGFFSVFQEKKIMPAAITTEGASISVTMCYSSNYSMKKFIDTLIIQNALSTPPSTVFLNTYYNAYFHSSQPVEYLTEQMLGSYATPYTYHYSYSAADADIQAEMQFPVYTSIINLISGESKEINLQSFDMKKNRWLGTRIPYFKPVKIDNEIYVEDHLHNPPLKSILNKTDIENFVVIHCYPNVSKEPDNMMELQDRVVDLSMNSYLEEQLFFIEKVNDWVDKGYLPKDKYKKISQFFLKINPEPLDYLDYTPLGLNNKYQTGVLKGEEFLSHFS